MLDLKFVRENPDIVKQNIKNKFQDSKLSLVDEVIALDAENRVTQKEADDLRASRNKLSKEIGKLMAQGKKEEADSVKAQVSANSTRLAELEVKEGELSEKIMKIMMTIPNIIDPSVPIGKDDSENVEVERYGVTVAMVNRRVTENRLADIAGKTRNVPENCELLSVARRMGVCLG